jgi:hypothetical protein
MLYYDSFNSKALELFTDLSNSFPNLTEFKKLKTGLIMMSNIDVKSPERIFKKFISDKFRQQILSKDEEFFLKHNEYEIWSNRKDYWLDFISQIKDVWSTIDNDNKEIIWKYFHILIILSDKCASK